MISVCQVYIHKETHSASFHHCHKNWSIYRERPTVSCVSVTCCSMEEPRCSPQGENTTYSWGIGSAFPFEHTEPPISLSGDTSPFHPHKHSNICSTYSVLPIQECFRILGKLLEKNPLIAEIDLQAILERSRSPAWDRASWTCLIFSFPGVFLKNWSILDIWAFHSSVVIFQERRHFFFNILHLIKRYLGIPVSFIFAY